MLSLVAGWKRKFLNASLDFFNSATVDMLNAFAYRFYSKNSKINCWQKSNVEQPRQLKPQLFNLFFPTTQFLCGKEKKKWKKRTFRNRKVQAIVHLLLNNHNFAIENLNHRKKNSVINCDWRKNNGELKCVEKKFCRCYVHIWKTAMKLNKRQSVVNKTPRFVVG